MFYLFYITSVSRTDCTNVFYATIRTKLDPLAYVLTTLYTSSNLCNDSLSFFSNLYVYYIVVVPTYVYINHYFVANHVYEFKIYFI